ncbi:hypothetical protein BCR34DRAFT_484560 [Clohesyomyces aquaticus]|uniref:Zn(2)-C6 fungal-type domain-containing protein n=1 Tax=Clohesyomyces aquaticus TaxID=1231657 RepID=A0A1Y1ZLV1_9PLEO|nr:hypothetical protein BCR34DRAFT_484560 [Clohesyomyces aquaticus]
MPKEATDLAVRKKMRKGTHSCFECRRRKIRCIYPSDNPDVCSECFARGSRCIDQENANPDVIVDHRKNLRERVSRLEALVDSLLEDKSERTERSTTETSSSKTPNIITREAFPPTPLSSDASSAVLQNLQHAPSERGHHVPILSVIEDALNDAEERMKERLEPQRKDSAPSPGIAQDRYTITCKHDDTLDDQGSTAWQAKRERAKKGLLAVLPPYDQLNKILNSNSEWWATWRRKCSGTSGELTLPQFTAKALAEGNIGAIGTVVLSVGICSDEDSADRYIEAVDRYLLSDDEYAATLEGMECLILKAKWYADVGQPRRAWLAYRKGLMYTQLMGLHRKRTSSAAHESIWWALYHGDRFISLLLGLPYGISDTHCDLSLPDMGGEYMAPLIFMNKVAILAGKVIDRNQGVAEQSFAWALQLDQELEDLWKKLDPNWIEFSHLMVDVDTNAAEIRERVMAQMVYHQIRVYLHLPFMLKSQANSRFTYSRTACLNGSREVLRLYQCLRTGDVQPLYECKAVDFIGFTSAVLIMLGLFNFGTSGGMSPKEQESDIRLIEISVDIFRRASSEKGGKVALQSAEVLEHMLHKLRSGHCDDFTDFVIPYFGTISIRRGGRPALPGGMPGKKRVPSTTVQPSPATSSQSQFTPSTERTTSDLFGQPLTAATTATSTSTSQDAFGFNTTTDPFVSYDGFYNLGSASAESTNGNALGAQINEDGLNNFPLPTNNFSWQNMPMDIDQDWSWFLNDNQAAMPAPPIGDQFAQSTFNGFG